MSDSYNRLAVPLNASKHTLILCSSEDVNTKFCATLKYICQSTQLHTSEDRDIIISNRHK